ncbi:N-acetyl-D-Glu racemase DgcA [Sinorhizobium sp. BG8]|uniref:N-acetyl-D-Glu racemase DgcA n=1 Tax=Sinorhizobium sp. BG8 TaxID=2613773 RepID=UPI00193CB0DD|nr:N-acetyl-D-Glu racemase DgcA [Sinorhizobium sp. BG8]QRM55673.1 dipeptide epimerase [Sinorhizobium sp. BG8]
MSRTLTTTSESFPIAGTFTISRGAKTTAEVVTCRISAGAHVGWGECVPYGRYGETVASVLDQISAVAAEIEAGANRVDLQSLISAGAARNALDCALWDLEAKTAGRPVWSMIGRDEPSPLVTAYTISLGEPDVMAKAAAEHAHRRLLKVKLGTSDDVSRIRAVRAAAPQSDIIVDANEGWTADSLARHFNACAEAGIALVEQPLPAGKDEALRHMARPVPVCADESVHLSGDLAALCDRYDAINIKLDKAGGLTEALAMRDTARALGLKVMVGCMVGTSLGMAPGVLLAQGAEFVDLDGPLLLARDRVPGLHYEASEVFPPEGRLWG